MSNLKLTAIRPLGGRATDTAHLAKVDHTYGPFNDLEWVKSLCGSTGRAVRAYGPDCKVCQRIVKYDVPSS